MPNYKGAAIVDIRNQISLQQSSVQKIFINNLSQEERLVYESCFSSTWVPLENAEKIVTNAVFLLYPDQENPFFQLGFDRAQRHLTGIYKVLVRISNPIFVINQSAKIWKIYYDQGNARSLFLKKHEYKAVMIVENYPNLPIAFREITSGYMTRAIQMTGAKNIRCHRDDSDPNAWKWYGSWD